MNILKVLSFLVEPGKGIEKPPPVLGLEIPKVGGLYSLLADIFNKAERECNINIAFNMKKDGTQNNEVHSLIVKFCAEPKIELGQLIAERLCLATTGRSDLGLLFLILGRQNENIKLVISRFPADNGILAEKNDTGLKLELIERIFMKNPKYYKAAFYFGRPIESDLWSGYAIDKQVNYRNSEIAQYWIQAFLDSNYKTTSKEGSKQFANAVLRASQTAKDLSIKQKLASLATLVSGLDGTAISINDIIKKYKLSPDVEAELIKNLPYPEYADTKFSFDADEFTANAPYSCVELDNEGMLIAPSNTFNEVFKRELLKNNSQDKDFYQFSTKGKIKKEQLRGRK